MAAKQSEQFLEPWRHLDEKVVLVTGASSGLGREFCLDLAMAGCKIVAAARRTDLLKSLCDEINSLKSSSSSSSENFKHFGVRAVAVELDVCADGSVMDASVQKAWEAFGRIDALINNAGVRGKF
ncbi:Short-chain dehydrogenase/reductase SDR [Macleaya cordata]|uniref:Short-chain dehydrogenase/reductase SDR n=1 Tax=Macleaya cordata TaxID=56857 RepID=A0A200QMA0_MACCD|nr:Short-chain dehydrogenase/reductase SDR [Macleaya cordata]